MKYDWLTETPFAHRGLHGPRSGHVENSLSAFHAANERGHGFELDILLSQDHKAIVFHDISLKRLTGNSGNIQEFSAQQLAQIKLTSSKDYIPTLSHVLSRIDPDYPILVEIKGDQNQPDIIANAVYQDIKDYDGPLAIMSFYPDIIAWFQNHAPHITRGLVATSQNDGSMPEKFFSLSAQKISIDRLGVDFVAYDIKALPNDITRYCRAQKIPLLTWTVRSPELLEKATQHTDNIIYENLP